VQLGFSEDRQRTDGWAPKWRKLLTSLTKSPGDFTEFDRTVRGMLNRISTENAGRLLPLEPSLRGAGQIEGGDCPAWWATRFAALMLNSYLRVIHTNRFARGLAVRSADNVLPEYLDAVAPLLAQSPRLVMALMAWFAWQLDMHDLCWPTTRLLLLAAREERDRGALPAHSLGRLPADVLQGRILAFLAPPPMLEGAVGLLGETGLPHSGNPVRSLVLNEAENGEDTRRDVIAVLVHLLMFSPPQIWPRLSAFGVCLAEVALGAGGTSIAEWRIYLAASVLTVMTQRLQARANAVEQGRLPDEDLGPLSRLATNLRDAADVTRRSNGLSKFVTCRLEVALDHAHRVQDSCGLIQEA